MKSFLIIGLLFVAFLIYFSKGWLKKQSEAAKHRKIQKKLCQPDE